MAKPWLVCAFLLHHLLCACVVRWGGVMGRSHGTQDRGGKKTTCDGGGFRSLHHVGPENWNQSLGLGSESLLTEPSYQAYFLFVLGYQTGSPMSQARLKLNLLYSQGWS